MKLHHTSRLILIQIKFAAETSLDYVQGPHQAVIRVFYLFFMMLIISNDGGTENIESCSVGAIGYIQFCFAGRPFVVIVFLRIIFPWTEGSPLWVFFSLKKYILVICSGGKWLLYVQLLKYCMYRRNNFEFFHFIAYFIYFILLLYKEMLYFLLH